MTPAYSPGSTLKTAQGEVTPQTVRNYVDSHRADIVGQFSQLLSIPSVQEDVPALQAAANQIEELARGRGFDVEQWPSSNGIPVVFAEKKVSEEARTILLYAHFDGQPVTADEWHQEDPFSPVIRTESIDNGGQVVSDEDNADFPDEWRIYARAAGDDKVSIQAILTAFDAIGSAPKHNVKLYLDGQEEAGGPGIGEMVEKHPDKLAADVLVLLDGPQHASGKPTIFYGSRGEAGLDVTVYTGSQGQHSGNYGNFLPDANVRLAQLLASMVEPSGRVAVEGFYADVPEFTDDDHELFSTVPDVTEQMKRALGMGGSDGVAETFQEALNLPALSIRALHGGEVGNVIPARASADIALRLVKETDRDAMLQRITDHIRSQGYHVISEDPDLDILTSHARLAKVAPHPLPDWKGNDPWRTEPQHPEAQAVTDSLRKVWGDDIVRLRTFGGTVPAAGFISGLDIPVVGVALSNYDNNQHAADENVRLGHLFDGAVAVSALLLE